jgi:hypothetical protein
MGKKTTAIQMGIQIISVSMPIIVTVAYVCRMATNVRTNVRILAKR